MKTAYNNSRSPKVIPSDTKTEQSHKNECDINNLLLKYQRTGVLEHRTEHTGQYGFVDALSFQDAQYIVSKARSMFEEVPSHIRSKFDHDPAKFLDFVQNPDNADQMVKMGLAHHREDIPSRVTQDEVFRVIREAAKAEATSGEPGTAPGNEPA